MTRDPGSVPEGTRDPGAVPERTRDAGAFPDRTRDPGASPERTRLAWRRTGMSAAAVALLAARPAFHPGAGPAQWLVAAAAMGGWAALAGLALRRAPGLRIRPPRPAAGTIRAYALITAGFAVIGGLVVML
ncbi:hypothetical protein Acy02nite_59960 [Actinoplanes cyaneus]|uniref:DUF202 domain-containing protein n=2 Tax=Actinoplanes cyaneus TaxID=52696 RepID=A0A919IL89_9ACTN|nr:DUF202 domain-containing protein [Actinoplanes cyaneus]MCW2141455.1 protein of unknown function (DUF202) [Actinoplanes cyaneus]GID68115.1 hypothetical protein Acy02nite_59960 [Actinoplanes cyaneus]